VVIRGTSTSRANSHGQISRNRHRGEVVKFATTTAATNNRAAAATAAHRHYLHDAAVGYRQGARRGEHMVLGRTDRDGFVAARRNY
jgi:hypothetical protein